MATACETCEFRSRCISSGWLSPNRVWFPEVVVLCPVEGCRRFVESIDRIKRRVFVEPIESAIYDSDDEPAIEPTAPRDDQDLAR